MVDLDIANSGGNTVTQVDASKGTSAVSGPGIEPRWKDNFRRRSPTMLTGVRWRLWRPMFAAGHCACWRCRGMHWWLRGPDRFRHWGGRSEIVARQQLSSGHRGAQYPVWAKMRRKLAVWWSSDGVS